MRFLSWLLALMLALIVLLFALDRWIVFSASKTTFDDARRIPPAGAILVPGARIYAGEVSGILAQRLDAAIRVHRTHEEASILVSGDYSGKYYDEAAAMRKYLLRHGIATGAILVDHAGFSTYDSVYRAKNVFGLQSVIIVSQSFHLPRAMFIARGLGLPAFGYRATGVPLSAEQALRSQWREPLARFKAIYDVMRRAPPAFTGSGLPLGSKGELLRW